MNKEKIKEIIKEYSLKLWDQMKKPRFWAFVITAIIAYSVVSFVGSRVINLVFYRERVVPQSKLSGIVCGNYNKRPFAVTLASDPQARPLSSLGKAEFVFEIPVTPDGITRIMAVYQCNEPDEIGSVRSARDGFVDLALGLDVILAHWGGEARALERLNDGEMDNINALIYEGTTFYRKNGVRSPHDGFTSFDLLKERAEDLGYNTETWDFDGYPRLKGRRDIGDERKVIRAYEAPYNVEWFYNEEENTYNRYRNGAAEIDAITDRQIEANVVIVAETTAEVYSIDYLDVNVIGSGKATVYQNGREIVGTWEKESSEAPLLFLDTEGNQIELVPGHTWVEFVT